MSVYKNDNLAYFRQAFESVYANSISPNEFVIVYDGEVPSDIKEYILKKREYYKKYSIIKIVDLPHNMGLGLALNEGLKYCSNDLVARADSDDINLNNRFERQLRYMEINPNVILLGGQIQEFSDLELLGTKRVVPTNSQAIKKFGQYRSPFNHPTVMFRKKKIQEVGGYRSFLGMEDYHLWARIIMSKFDYANLPDVLVNMRATFYSRRGGKQYLKNYIKLRLFFHKIGFSSILNTIFCIILMSISSILPTNLRKWVYINILRNTKTGEIKVDS